MRQVLGDSGQIRVRPRRRALIAVPVALAAALALTACGGNDDDPADEPAEAFFTLTEEAKSAECADLLEQLPETVLGRSRTAQDSVGMATWGDPPIYLACGATPTGPTTDACIDVNDVAWVFSETPEHYRFLTYGRTPAVEVQVPTSVERTQATGALVDLSEAVAPLEQTERRCYDAADSAPSASPS
ncbi:DUF3515 family protein [Kineosporia babensis]|uniref:DUF3515 domain-containing protein n=1 Tax=Kineosporia babensis TaxID=499548 RepID=A0A9X1SWA6_9ACTN|nr:DUF3515 family protein [Kineosporia babensis]MCD5313750.1 DUF3515 domain-containing protein [Kineosporia babensis]